MGTIKTAAIGVASVAGGITGAVLLVNWWINRGDRENPGPKKSVLGLLFGGGLGGDELLASGSGGKADAEAKDGSGSSAQDGGASGSPGGGQPNTSGGGGGSSGDQGSGAGGSGGSSGGGVGGGSGGGVGGGQGSGLDGDDSDGTGTDNDGDGGGDDGGGNADDPEQDAIELIGQYGDLLIEEDLPPPNVPEVAQQQIIKLLTDLVMNDVLEAELPPPYDKYNPEGGSKLAYWADVAFYTMFSEVPYGRLNPYNATHVPYIQIWQSYLKFAYLAQQSKAQMSAAQGNANLWLDRLLAS